VSLRDDVVLRVIHQLVEALLRAIGLRKKRDFPGAEQAIGDGLTGLGLSLEVITRLDAATLTSLLGDKRALVGVALLELANVRAAEGKLDDVARFREVGARLLDGAEVPDELRALKPLLSTTPEDARMSW
jgi:hypothetical protein